MSASSYRLVPVVLALLLAVMPHAAAADVIDFESLMEGQTVDQVPAPSCSGPVEVNGTNPNLGQGTNAARVFDSSDPTGGDSDLGTPNEDFGGPGMGQGGEAGSSFPNDMMLGQVLIIDEDLMGEPDDADAVGSTFNFDFSSCGTVTVQTIDLLDVESVEMPATVTLFGPNGTVVASFELPNTGNNGLADGFSLGPTSGVERVRVMLDGSGAIDNLVFTPDAQVDLAVTKTDSTDPVAQGGTLAYEITVTNNGPDTATGVTAVDTLPGSVSFVAATPASCSHSGETNGGTVTCDLGTLAAGDNAMITIEVTAPNQDTTITNRVTVSADENDSDGSNDAAQESTTVGLVGPGVDLAVTKSDSPDPVQAGAILTYTITVSNQDPSERATGVDLVDTLPATVAFVSATPEQGDCTHSGEAAGGTVTCDLGGIAAGDSVSVTLQVRPEETGGEPRTITNDVTVSANEPEADGSDNSAMESTQVIAAEADLSLVKTDSPDPVAEGSTLTYTLEVTNDGPSTATGVTVEDMLPPSVTLLSAETDDSGGSCGTDADGDVVCSLDDLEPGDSTTITLRVRPTAPGEITNSAVVSSDQAEPPGQDGDNGAAESTTVSPATALPIPTASEWALGLLALLLATVGVLGLRRMG